MATVQHLMIRVSDIERSTRFYVEGLDGVVVVNTYLNDKAFTELVMGARDTEYLINFIELPDGFGIELAQFLPDVHQPIGRPQYESGFMHFALHVDDVEAALARAEAAGGERVADPGPWASDPAKYAYIKDPDGNIIEFNDTTWERILGAAVELHPEAALDAADRSPS